MKEKKLYILGHPISHSKSPVMYNAVYDKYHFMWEYLPMDLSSEVDAENFIESKNYLAINITTPYKPLAFRCASLNAASAQLAGGSNLLVVRDNHLLGYNVDGIGCVSFLENQNVTFQNKDIVICGTGPTSLSIMQACAQAGASKITMLGRDKNKTKQVVDNFLDLYYQLSSTAIDLPDANKNHRTFLEAYKDCEYLYGAYDTSRNVIHEADLIIDATPLGMQENDPAPFDCNLMHKDQVVLDTVYGHGITNLISRAKAAGAKTFDGSGMLAGQAVKSFVIVCEVNDIEVPASYNKLFETMATAAGFEF